MEKNPVLQVAVAFLLSGLLLCCNKPKSLELTNEGSVYMPQAVGTRAKIDLQLSTKPQDISFGAAYGGLNYSDKENEVSFKIDPALVAAYNSANGTNYTLLPDSVYTISGLNSVIPSGRTSSNPLTLSVASSRVSFGTRYILPITLTNSTNGIISPDLQTTYFRFDTILRKSVDITGQGVLTVSNENPGGPSDGEGSLKLTDNDINSKYLYFGFDSEGWFQVKFPTAVAVGAYTFTSANDASDRDPKDWTLKGSNDGVNWTVIDTRSGESFNNRFQTKRYELPGAAQAFTHYRIFLTANNGSWLFQMAEWRLIKYE